MKYGFLIVLAVIILVGGCGDSHKQIFNPTPDSSWVKAFGDDEQSRTAYNVVALDKNNAKQHKALGQAIIALSKKIDDMNERITQLTWRDGEQSASTIGPADNMVCPKCGKKMIKQYTNTALTTYPPQYPWSWWCGCGYTAEGGVEKGKTTEQMSREAWEAINANNP
jgi:hypothetical protein